MLDRPAASRRGWPSWRSHRCARSSPARPGGNSRPRARRAGQPAARRKPGACHVRFDHGAAAGLEALRAAGARDPQRQPPLPDGHGRRSRRPTARVAGVSGVAGRHRGLAPDRLLNRRLVHAGASSLEGVRTTEGVGERHRGSSQRILPRRRGVTVGILSDSFDTGDRGGRRQRPDRHPRGRRRRKRRPAGRRQHLQPARRHPSPSSKKPQPELGEEPTDEGRAMAQIVHDIAPGANRSPSPPPSTAKTPLRKTSNDCTVAQAARRQGDRRRRRLLEEPFFQDGPVAVAVNKVVSEEATYFPRQETTTSSTPKGTKSPPGKHRNSGTRAPVRLKYGRSKGRTRPIASTSIPAHRPIGHSGSKLRRAEI